MEYATREQAQNAVATLSNQNLMGRLIYVREVRFSTALSVDQSVAKRVDRIVRPNLALARPVALVAAASWVVRVELLLSPVVTQGSIPAWLAAAVARSMSPTSVQPCPRFAFSKPSCTNPRVSFLTPSVGKT